MKEFYIQILYKYCSSDSVLVILCKQNFCKKVFNLNFFFASWITQWPEHHLFELFMLIACCLNESKKSLLLPLLFSVFFLLLLSFVCVCSNFRSVLIWLISLVTTYCKSFLHTKLLLTQFFLILFIWELGILNSIFW